ncbi:MAG: hypothetical protein HRS50_02070 [Mycoplasmataceae bacterium]|nr:hypothetical protein [Mycoplasmataceae bacterium]
MEKLFQPGMSVKQIGVSFSGLKEKDKIYKQLNILEVGHIKHDKIQTIAEEVSDIFKIEIVKGSTMKNNRKYLKKEPLDNDSVKFKV